MMAKEYLLASDFDQTLSFNDSGIVLSEIVRVAAGYGKVAVLDELQAALQVGSDRIVYVGDGSSDVHVMLHVNRRDGFTIAASEAKLVAQIARRTIIGDDALSVLVPLLEDIVGMTPARIRSFFEEHGLAIQEWDRVRTDWLTIGQSASDHGAAASLATAAR